jgi:CBS-domain-containing membrane protein
MTKVIKEFQLFWRRYLLQSFFATLTIFVVLLLLSLQHAVIVASIGATAFIIFAMPQNITAKPRNVIGGHLVGLLSGSLCALIPHGSFFYSILVYSLAVGISIFVMVVINTEHPPASGTALGAAITGFSSNAIIAVITSVVMLSLVHRFLGSRLKCLT